MKEGRQPSRQRQYHTDKIGCSVSVALELALFLLNFSLIPPPSTPWLLPLPFSATTATLYLQLTLVCFCVSACLHVCVCVPSSHLGHLAGLYKYHTIGGSLTGFSQLTEAKEQGCWHAHIYTTSLMVNTVVRCVRCYTHSNQR